MTVCQYFLKGNCRFGDRCRFDHPTPERQGNVCQHFLRGNCRFGDRCRNEHPSGGHSGFGRDTSFSYGGHRSQSSFGGHGSTPLTSSQRWQSGHAFGQNRFDVLSGGETAGNTFGHQQKPTSSQDTGHMPSQIQQTVKRDLEAWEANSQWPLSCYAYVSKGPCFSGLIDHSPEELRLEAYKCIAEGKPAVYEQGLRELLVTHKQRRAQFKTMSAAQIYDVVVKSSEAVAEDSGFSSVFGASQATSSQGAGGMFSGVATSTQPGGFGSGTSMSQGGSFPTQQSSGLFGGGSQSGGNMFGMVTPQGSSQSFGSGSAQMGSLFGSQPKSHDGSSMVTEASGFGTAPGNSQSAIKLGSGLASGAFGSENSGTMGTAQTQFGQGSVIASSEAMTTPASASASQYSDEDLAAFKAPMFTLGKIPECPPPPELC